MSGPVRELSACEDFESVPYLDVSLDDPEFRNFAGIYSDVIFDIFVSANSSTSAAVA